MPRKKKPGGQANYRRTLWIEPEIWTPMLRAARRRRLSQAAYIREAVLEKMERDGDLPPAPDPLEQEHVQEVGTLLRRIEELEIRLVQTEEAAEGAQSAIINQTTGELRTGIEALDFGA